MRPVLCAVCCFFLAVCISCDNGKSPTGGAFLMPPSHPKPLDNALAEPLNNLLQWQCRHNDDDPVSYTLYFGITNPPPLLIESVPQTSASVYDLLPDTRYYWRVVARSSNGTWLSSPVWTFRTSEHGLYPLDPGYNWAYGGRAWYDNFQPHSLAEEFAYSEEYTSVVIPEGTEIIYPGGVPMETKLLVCRTNGFGDMPAELVSKAWYVNKPDGLYEQAYEADNTYVLPKPIPRASSSEVVLNSLGISGGLPSAALGAQLMFDTAKVYNYPYDEPAKWIYRSVSPYFAIYKEYAGSSHVEVPAGSFDCTVIRWTWEFSDAMNGKITAFDYVATVGLVKREINFEGIPLLRYDSQEPAGYADMHIVVELTGLFGYEYTDPPGDSVILEE